MKQREFLLKSTCLASLLVGAPVQMFPPLSANAQKYVLLMMDGKRKR